MPVGHFDLNGASEGDATVAGLQRLAREVHCDETRRACGVDAQAGATQIQLV